MTGRRTIFRWFADYEKEEAWLNKMAARGFDLETFVLGFYTFREGSPGEYAYRIELLGSPARGLSRYDYFRFLEETGIEIVATWFKWVYYRRKASEGPFDVYSDAESRIGHYRRVAVFMLAVGVLNLAVFAYNAAFTARLFANLGGAPAGLSIFAITSINVLAGIAAVTTGARMFLKSRRLGREKTLRE
ncbi:MAG: DUF2812 domain-containing protein [Defluviitaleaceae bacterium]|nr:DUF2812 domain-containing protein [Defluviitaleaceae bacterium]